MVVMNSNECDRTLFCGNLHNRCTEELLYELFLQAGPLEKVSIPSDKDGRKRNFAFITFKHVDSVPYTIELLNGVQMFDRKLNLQIRPNSIHESRQKEQQQMAMNHHQHGPPPDMPMPLLLPGAPGHFHRSASMPDGIARSFPQALLSGPAQPLMGMFPGSHSGSNSPALAADTMLGSQSSPMINLNMAPGRPFNFQTDQRSRDEAIQFEIQRQRCVVREQEKERQMGSRSGNRDTHGYQPYQDRRDNRGRDRNRPADEDFRLSDQDFRSPDQDYRSSDHDYRGAQDRPGDRRQDRRDTRNFDHRRRR